MTSTSPDGTQPPPTLFAWAGGAEAWSRLTRIFYGHVRDDPILAPVFAEMRPEHPEWVAQWLGEVFGGPATYTQERGGYPHMLSRHLGRALTEQQRARWVRLMGEAADEAGLPADPEFRSAFVSYLEWGSRIALANSQPGAQPPPRMPVPHWDWARPAHPARLWAQSHHRRRRRQVAPSNRPRWCLAHRASRETSGRCSPTVTGPRCAGHSTSGTWPRSTSMRTRSWTSWPAGACPVTAPGPPSG